jgi:hypothetical protein
MNTCQCGNAIKGNSAQCPRCAALQLLGVAVDASEDEIKTAYRLLVKVWHPDRFPGDPKLKETAENKFKEINSAYILLTSTPAQHDRRQPPASANASTEPEDSPQPAPKKTIKAASAEIPGWIPEFHLWPIIKFFFKVVALAFACLLCRYLWIAFDFQGSAGDEVTSVYKSGKDNLLKGLEAPKMRFLDALERDLQRIHWRSSSAEAGAPAMPPAADDQSKKKLRATPQPLQSTVPKIRPYVTVGSTRDEVITQQGTPTESTQDKLVYGNSELYLKNNLVMGWRIDPASSSIRVKLWPQTFVDPDLEYFVVGSSKDVVLAVQGTPTEFSEDNFKYGNSIVCFRNNRVISWKQDPASIQLRAR